MREMNTEAKAAPDNVRVPQSERYSVSAPRPEPDGPSRQGRVGQGETDGGALRGLLHLSKPDVERAGERHERGQRRSRWPAGEPTREPWCDNERGDNETCRSGNSRPALGWTAKACRRGSGVRVAHWRFLGIVRRGECTGVPPPRSRIAPTACVPQSTNRTGRRFSLPFFKEAKKPIAPVPRRGLSSSALCTSLATWRLTPLRCPCLLGGARREIAYIGDAPDSGRGGPQRTLPQSP